MKWQRLILGLAAALVVAICGSCARDVRLAGKDIPHVTVRTVTHYDRTLDADAPPEEVAYVALRAIREDFLAETEAERRAALMKQFDVCAANVIAGKRRVTGNRDEDIYNVVYHWTPTVSHYVHNFDFDWEKARKRLVRRDLPSDERSQTRRCVILMELEAPGGDPNARVVLNIWMGEDKGYWRVTHLGFDNTRRTIGG